MGAVLSVAGLRALIDHLSDGSDGSPLLVLAAAVVDDVHDEMHLAWRDAERWEQVESILAVDTDRNVDDLARVLPLGRADGREEQVRAVVLPVQPLKLAELWDTGADSGARMQVVVLGHILWEEEPDAGDLAKFGFDNVEVFLDRSRCAVEAACSLR